MLVHGVEAGEHFVGNCSGPIASIMESPIAESIE